MPIQLNRVRQYHQPHQRQAVLVVFRLHQNEKALMLTNCNILSYFSLLIIFLSFTHFIPFQTKRTKKKIM
jgi:hypothetical protein